MQGLDELITAIDAVEHNVGLYRQRLLPKTALERQIRDLERNVDVYLRALPAGCQHTQASYQVKGSLRKETSAIRLRQGEAAQYAQVPRLERSYSCVTLKKDSSEIVAINSESLQRQITGSATHHGTVSRRRSQPPGAKSSWPTSGIHTIVPIPATSNIASACNTHRSRYQPQKTHRKSTGAISTHTQIVRRGSEKSSENLEERPLVVKKQLQPALKNKLRGEVGNVWDPACHDEDIEALPTSVHLKQEHLAEVASLSHAEHVQLWVQARNQWVHPYMEGNPQAVKDTWRSMLTMMSSRDLKAVVDAVQTLRRTPSENQGEGLTATFNSTITSSAELQQDDNAKTASLQIDLAKEPSKSSIKNASQSLDVYPCNRDHKNHIIRKPRPMTMKDDNREILMEEDILFVKYSTYMTEHRLAMDEAKLARQELNELRTRHRKDALHRVEMAKAKWERETGKNFRMHEEKKRKPRRA